MIIIKYNRIQMLVYSSNNVKSSLFDVYDMSCLWIVDAESGIYPCPVSILRKFL